jgi:hypothetical protein
LFFRPSIVTIRSNPDGSQGQNDQMLRKEVRQLADDHLPADGALWSAPRQQSGEHVLGALQVLGHDARGAHRIALAHGREQPAVLAV